MGNGSKGEEVAVNFNLLSMSKQIYSSLQYYILSSRIIFCLVEFENEGNFRAILKYRSYGDTFLFLNIFEEEKGYKYISPKIQNEIICICDQLILKEIVGKINAAERFSV